MISETSDTNGARNASPIQITTAPKAEAKRRDFDDPMLDDFKDHYNVIFIGHVGRLIFYPCAKTNYLSAFLSLQQTLLNTTETHNETVKR